MGNTVYRAATRPFRSFNVESRAQKVIAKDKPISAPRHKGTDLSPPPAMQEEIRSKIQVKLDPLHERLRDVKVVSEGINPEIKRVRENLPKDRESPSMTYYGFEDPRVTPKGKLPLSQILALLSKHCDNPKAYGAKQAAEEYNLEVREAELFLEYYMPLTVIDPDSAADMKRLGLKKKSEVLKEFWN